MRERIRQLAEQCGFRSNPNIYDRNQSFDIQKFSELIVKECAEIGDNYQDILGNEPECANCRKVAYGIVDKIKEHFGVEK